MAIRSINDIRKTLQAKIEKAGEYWLEKVPADLGNHAGVVKVPDKQSMVYVRLTTGQVIEVFNDSAPNIYNWKVYIGKDKSQPSLLKVIEVRWVYNIAQTVAYVLFHHSQHEFPAPDTVWVRRDQFMPLLVLPMSGLSVGLFGDTIYNPRMDNPIRVDDEEIDLTSYVPAIGAKYVLLEVDANGDVNIVEGDLVDSKETLYQQPLPAPTEGSFPVCAIVLYEGQTTIRRDSTVRDIIDLRMFTSEATPTVATQLSEAEESLYIDDWDYIGYFESTGGALKKIKLSQMKVNLNQYATEIYSLILNKLSTYLPLGSDAGGDLDGTYPNPSVVKIQGVPVDANLSTLIEDGNALVYNLANNQIEAGEGGGGGTPMVYDDLTSQIPAASDHFDLVSAADGAVLLFYNTTMQSTDTFTMDVDNLGLTTSFSPVAGDKLIAVYGLSGTFTQAGSSPALTTYIWKTFG